MSHAALRLERFKKAQASIDEALRLENRNDLDVTHQRHRMESTLEQHRSAKRWFIEYLQTETPDLDPQRYFNPGHPSPDRVLLKKYAIFMALSRVGKIADTIAVQTLINYIRLLFTVLGIDRGRRLDKAVSDDVLSYVHNDMVKEYNLSRERWCKPVAHSEDLTYLLSVLYTPTVIGTLSNMRQLLNLNLFWNLMVDTGARGGDIAWDRKTPLSTCLCWDDIKLYNFWNPSIGTTEVRANITFRYLKGMKLEPHHYKTIPFALFPTSMVKEDSLRLILITALMDGVLNGGIKTWDDLVAAPSSETGLVIPIKECFKNLPLLRKVDARTCTLTEEPEQLRDLQLLTRRLGRAAGLEARITAYCLRRGVAFTLALKTSADNRRFIMGHKTASRIYSEYASRIATVDLAGLYRDQDPRQIKQMSSMRLNSSTAVPQKISLEGFARAKMDLRYCSLLEVTDELRDKLTMRHANLAAASRSSHPDWAKYKQNYSRQHVLAAACRKIYDEEYAAFFRSNERPGDRAVSRPQESEQLIASRSGSSSSTPSLAADTPPSDTTMSDLRSDNASVIAPDFFPFPNLGSEFEDITFDLSLFDPQTSSSDEQGAIIEEINVDDGITNIDPELLQMDTSNLLARDGEEERIDELLGDEDGEDSHLPLGSDVTVTTATGAESDAVRTAAQSTRLHGISRKDQLAIDAYVAKTKLSRPSRDNSGIDRTYVDPTFCNSILAVFDSDGAEAELALKLGDFYRITHPIDRFYPGQEPLPGTYLCIFCDVDLKDVVHASLHVFRCGLKQATDEACRVADELFPFTKPCKHTIIKKVKGVSRLVECGKAFPNRQKYGQHVSSHLGGLKTGMMFRDDDNKLVPTCFYSPCAHPPPTSGKGRTGIVFESNDERKNHLMTVHQIISTTSPKPIFCEFCYMFVLPHEADSHFEQHIGTCDLLVKEHGYTGLFGLGRTLIPTLCIFCYHNDTLGASERLDTQCGQGSSRYQKHCDAHIVEITDAVQCPAYPQLCTLSTPLTSQEMRDHLASVHAVIVKQTPRKGKRKSNAKLPSKSRKKNGGKAVKIVEEDSEEHGGSRDEDDDDDDVDDEEDNGDGDEDGDEDE